MKSCYMVMHLLDTCIHFLSHFSNPRAAGLLPALHIGTLAMRGTSIAKTGGTREHERCHGRHTVQHTGKYGNTATTRGAPISAGGPRTQPYSRDLQRLPQHPRGAVLAIGCRDSDVSQLTLAGSSTIIMAQMLTLLASRRRFVKAACNDRAGCDFAIASKQWSFTVAVASLHAGAGARRQ